VVEVTIRVGNRMQIYLSRKGTPLTPDRTYDLGLTLLTQGDQLNFHGNSVNWTYANNHSRIDSSPPSATTGIVAKVAIYRHQKFYASCVCHSIPSFLSHIHYVSVSR
jgi:hypothetical protein